MRIIFIIIILFFFNAVTAQKEKLMYDSSQVQQRHFTSSSLKAYRSNEDFQYEKETVETPSAWDRCWQNNYENYLLVTWNCRCCFFYNESYEHEQNEFI